MWSDVYGFGGPTSAGVVWEEIVLIGEESSYFNGIGGQSMDCIDFLDEWLVINDSVGGVFGGSKWIDATGSTLSIKIA